MTGCTRSWRSYPRGGKIPTEKQLAEEFKVSRAALNALTPNHLIVRQHCVGFFRQQRAVNYAIEYLLATRCSSA